MSKKSPNESAAPLGLIIAGVAIAVGGVVLARNVAPTKKSDIWLEVAKASLTLGLVGLVAAVIAWYLRSLDDRRSRTRELITYRLELVRSLIDAYSDVKSSRRRLRVFRTRANALTNFDALGLLDFNAQMQVLSEAELAVEQVMREIEARESLFSESTTITQELDKPKTYLRRVIGEWESIGARFKDGGNPVEIGTMKQFTSFLDDTTKGFNANVADPIGRAINGLRADLLE